MIVARTGRLLPAAACLAAVLALVLSGCAGSSKRKGGKRKTVLMSEYDDEIVGREASKQVEAQIGVLDDPDLNAYVSGIGKKLLRGIPNRPFQYEFSVVDQAEPNAFALPGGHIYISRGLLVAANDEDELACVIGHEITHAAKRHAAARQAQQRRGGFLAMGWYAAGRTAAYGRDMERDADKGGQILCAAAGYDPMGMSTFLRSLDLLERIRRGSSRLPGFFDTHPGASERAAINAVRAREIRWQRDRSLGDTRARLLQRTAGLAVDQRPQAGMFVEDTFVHPGLGFQVRFPHRWRLSNTNSAVGAGAPKGDAMIFLEADLPEGDPKQIAEQWLANNAESQRLTLIEAQPIMVGDIEAWRIRVDMATSGGAGTGYIAFFPYRGATWRVTGLSASFSADRNLPRVLSTIRSFRPVTPEELRALRWEQLEVTTADTREGLEALSARTDNEWSVLETAVYNGVKSDHVFEGGELVKTASVQVYRAPATH